jgi:hypothetical protein
MDKTKSLKSKSKKSLKSKSTKIKRIYNLKIKKTKDDGNCFYSSIYRSLVDKNLIKKFYKCFPKLKSIKENTFIYKMRHFVASKSDVYISNMFNNFIVSNLDKDTFKEIVTYLGSITKVLLSYYKKKKYDMKYKSEFIKDIKKIIKKDKNWVGELEVDIVKDLFKTKCKIINLKIFNNYSNAVKDIKKDIINLEYDNTIYIINDGEIHYEYI